jgi:hypothetical protein
VSGVRDDDGISSWLSERSEQLEPMLRGEPLLAVAGLDALLVLAVDRVVELGTYTLPPCGPRPQRPSSRCDGGVLCRCWCETLVSTVRPQCARASLAASSRRR